MKRKLIFSIVVLKDFVNNRYLNFGKGKMLNLMEGGKLLISPVRISDFSNLQNFIIAFLYSIYKIIQSLFNSFLQNVANRQ
jgi:hypothetical protein